MKKTFLTSLLFIGVLFLLNSQAPFEFNYQAVARDISGNIMKNKQVKIKISILKSGVSGESVYSETHAITTNDFGLINFKIGNGNNKSGSIENINWGQDKYFLQVEMDKSGGNSFDLLGTSQLISVPYALFSGNGVQFDMDMTCDETTEGTIRYNYDDKIMEFCDGSSWTAFGNSGTNTTCGEDFIDPRDGQVYPTVKIGDQCWMAKNLNYGVYKESVFENTPNGHSDVSNNGVVEKYALDNDTTNFAKYGGLYDWNEMMNYSNTEGTQGICPDGWHIPTDAELLDLIESAGGGNIGGKNLMVGGTTGFNFITSGSRLMKGKFDSVTAGDIWSSTTQTTYTTRAWLIYFTDGKDNVSHSTDLKVVGKSVRCIKN